MEKKYIDIISDDKKQNYSLNLLVAEMNMVPKAEKKVIKSKISHSFYKRISPIIFSMKDEE